jgi:N-acetylglucosaminyl-diphospho-decaprenol L-rhamnosyltransferase
MKTLIVIVNWRTGDLTIDCLRSLTGQVTDPSVNARVVVADNASGDGSIQRIAAAIADHGWTWASTLELPKNGGFAYGNNQAIRSVWPDLGDASNPGAAQRPAEGREYVVLLNPDTVVREGALRELVRFMDEHPKAGIAGSRLEDPDGTIQISAFRFHGVASEFERGMKLGLVTRLLRGRVVAPPAPSTPAETDWLAGASMIVRREVFQRIGLLDEGYFMYYEEVDFCLRARRAGFEVWYVPTSRVVHLVGAASELSDARRHRKRRPGYWFDSRRRFYLKNFGPWRGAAADAAFIIGHAVYRVRRWIQRKPDTDPPMFLWDSIRNSVFVRGARL